jgi:hypothetical protein
MHTTDQETDTLCEGCSGLGRILRDTKAVGAENGYLATRAESGLGHINERADRRRCASHGLAVPFPQRRNDSEFKAQRQQ